MKYENVVIRSKERLERMGKEMRDAIFDIYDRGGFEGKSFPIVYQYTKGVDGDSVGADRSDIVGEAMNLDITSGGDFVCDVIIHDVMQKSIHFENVIDNMVIGKHCIEHKNEEVGPAVYELVQFIIYDRQVRAENNRALTMTKNVEKTYNAPTEAYMGNPSAGGAIQRMVEKGNDIIKEICSNKSGEYKINQ